MADERLIAALTRERFGTPDRRTFRAAGRTTFTSPPIGRTCSADTPDAIEERRRILCQALAPTSNVWREAADAARQAEREALTAARRAATAPSDTAPSDTAPDNVVYLSRYRGAA